MSLLFRYKPGTQHLKLKHELEEQIAEQRSMEWEKRLEAEKKLKSEMNGELSDDDIEKIEAKLEDIEAGDKPDEETGDESSEGEEEPIENDVILEDKPKKRNPMVDDEAEESEVDEEIGEKEEKDLDEADLKDCDADVEDGDEDLEDEDESSDSSSSESEEEVESKPKKGRILKAFEDSDDESTVNNQDNIINSETGLSFKDVPVAIDENEIKETQGIYFSLYYMILHLIIFTLQLFVFKYSKCNTIKFYYQMMIYNWLKQINLQKTCFQLKSLIIHGEPKIKTLMTLVLILAPNHFQLWILWEQILKNSILTLQINFLLILEHHRKKV